MTRARSLFLGVAVSLSLALFAYATNGFGWSPLPEFRSAPLSLAASSGWIVSIIWLTARHRWRGLVSLIGAPAALAFPLFWLRFHDTVVYACAANIRTCP